MLAVVGSTMALAVWSRPRWRPWRLVGPAVVVGGRGRHRRRGGHARRHRDEHPGFVRVVLCTALSWSRTTARAYVGLVVVVLGAALAVNPFPGALHTLAYVVLTAGAAGEALSGTVHRLRRLAVSDPLTGLLNREGLRRAADAALLGAERTGDSLTVAVLDLDGFTAVHDQRGHAAGDALLVQLADAWTHELRPGDLLSRWGGDEFVLLLPGADRAAATATVRRLAAASACGWSYGFASYAPGSSLDALLHVADADLYRAKSRRAVAVPTAV